MPEVKLGTKHECQNCSAKFYDLGKKEPVCPKCGTNQKDLVKEARESKPPAASKSARRKRKTEVVADKPDTDEPDEGEDLDDLEDDELLDDEELEEELSDELDDEEDEDDED